MLNKKVAPEARSGERRSGGDRRKAERRAGSLADQRPPPLRERRWLLRRHEYRRSLFNRRGVTTKFERN